MIRLASLKWIAAVHLLETLLFEVLFAVIKVGSCCCETTTNMAEKTFFSWPVNCSYSTDIKSCWGVYVVTDFQLCADFCLQRLVCLFVFFFFLILLQLNSLITRHNWRHAGFHGDIDRQADGVHRRGTDVAWATSQMMFHCYYNMTDVVCVCVCVSVCVCVCVCVCVLVCLCMTCLQVFTLIHRG